MPTKKIAEPLPLPCNHPEHYPPSHRVFSPGVYEHTCPRCGHVVVFNVAQVSVKWKSYAKKSLQDKMKSNKL